MPLKRVLLTVTTYPLPSRSYDELVCTAGVLEDGSWIRIYPVPLSFLSGLKKDGVVGTTKYTWIELNLKKRQDDFRPESHSPEDYEFKDLVVGEHLGTEHEWAARKQFCLTNVYTNLKQLIEESKAPKNLSLATFKPAKILGLDIEKDTDDWKETWKALQNQLSLFGEKAEEAREVMKKLPYKFFYRFVDEQGTQSRMMIEDWEIGALYWNCLRMAQNDEATALQKVREKYFDDFISKRDVYFFMGTTKEWHMRRGKNPFVIIGVFYPKKKVQLTLF
ncbi:hypothetical protein [Haliscomenobacter sp.]|uniref:hypothetical protein n=1 Tax=Haliscomenobacter sp. TaxID=2717303 RepID=UPI003364F735